MRSDSAFPQITLDLLFMHLVVAVVWSDVPGRPRGVRVVKCLTTAVQLNVEPPQYNGGPRVTGFIIHNQLQVTRVNLGITCVNYDLTVKVCRRFYINCEAPTKLRMAWIGWTAVVMWSHRTYSHRLKVKKHLHWKWRRHVKWF